VYKFELTLTDADDSTGAVLRKWFIQKRHDDFTFLDSEIRKSVGSKHQLSNLPPLPARETVLTIYGTNRSTNILKRCRQLCAYLRFVLSNEATQAVEYARDFLLLNAHSFFSNFSSVHDVVMHEGSIDVCVGCSSLSDVTYFKRRWAVYGSGGFFLYRHHDDDPQDFVACLDFNVDLPGAVLKSERMLPGGKSGGKKKEEHSYWRVWLHSAEGDGGMSPRMVNNRAGSLEHDVRYEANAKRWSIVCRGTARGCNDWMDALSGGVGSEEKNFKKVSTNEGLELMKMDSGEVGEVVVGTGEVRWKVEV
jgi:hypothetical protein